MAVLSAWDSTALDDLTAAAGTTEEDGVGSLWSLDGQLIKGIDLATSLDDSGTCSLSEIQGAHLNGRELQDTEIISNSAHNHCNLFSPVLESLDEALERNGDFVGSAVVETLQDHLVKARWDAGVQEFVKLNQQSEVRVVAPHFGRELCLWLCPFFAPIVTLREKSV